MGYNVVLRLSWDINAESCLFSEQHFYSVMFDLFLIYSIIVQEGHYIARK